jgi:hypothetical protein
MGHRSRVWARGRLLSLFWLELLDIPLQAGGVEGFAVTAGNRVGFALFVL